jgi:hypothetical protein
MLPRHSAASSRLRGQVVKGGTQVRGANENYRTAYLMCVLYAFVVIVLAGKPPLTKHTPTISFAQCRLPDISVHLVQHAAFIA